MNKEKREEKREKEIEKRERLVQTYLIIAGFLLAYAKEEVRQGMVSVFSAYLIFTIVYYIYVSRTKNSSMINLWAFYSSLSYSLLFSIFINSQTGLSTQRFLGFFIVLTGALTFSLLSPESNDNIINWFERFAKNQEKKHPKLTKGICYILIIIVFIWLIYNLIVSLPVYKNISPPS